MGKKNILITLWNANALHGGVKYSAELGNFFHSIGYNVWLCGVNTTDEVKVFFTKNHVNMFGIHEDLPDIEFDIVWAHHWPIFPYLIRKGLRYKKLINSCISSILLVERPIALTEHVDLYLCLTDEERNKFIAEFNIPEQQIKILPNTAPDEYFIATPQYTKLNSIAIVSNHAPQELLDTIKIFKEKKITVTIYGGKNQKNITPDILKKHDVIVSIGKTVQYCLAMGKPIYNYDYFGGSGYITPKNIDTEEQKNFSGRSFYTKKTSEQIVDEIIEQYNCVLTYQQELKQIAQTRYKLSERINEILDILNKTPNKPIMTDSNKTKLFIDYCCVVVDGPGASSLTKFPTRGKIKESPLHRIWRHIKPKRF